MSTVRHARRIGINGHNGGWSAPENEALKRLYPTALRAVVEAALPGRSWNAMHLQAATLNLKRRRYWNEERLAMLHQYYPVEGAAYVAQLLDCPVAKVTKAASLHNVKRVYAPKPVALPIPHAPKLPKVVPAKVVQPKPTPKPKPLPKPKPVPEPVAQHQPARLNNLINQKAQHKKKATAGPERAVPLAYIKTLPYEHPEAHHYRMGGERAVLRYREQLTQQAA